MLWFKWALRCNLVSDTCLSVWAVWSTIPRLFNSWPPWTLAVAAFESLGCLSTQEAVITSFRDHFGSLNTREIRPGHLAKLPECVRGVRTGAWTSPESERLDLTWNYRHTRRIFAESIRHDLMWSLDLDGIYATWPFAELVTLGRPRRSKGN